MLNTVEPLIPHSSARRDNSNFSTSCRYIVETGRQKETEKERERERFGGGGGRKWKRKWMKITVHTLSDSHPTKPKPKEQWQQNCPLDEEYNKIMRYISLWFYGFNFPDVATQQLNERLFSINYSGKSENCAKWNSVGTNSLLMMMCACEGEIRFGNNNNNKSQQQIKSAFRVVNTTAEKKTEQENRIK